VEITGPSRRRSFRSSRSSTARATPQNTAVGPSSQALPADDQTATAAVVSLLVDDVTKDRIISEAKTRFRRFFFSRSPFLSQDALDDLNRDSVRGAMDTILRGKLCGILYIFLLICNANRFSVSIN